MEGFFSGFSGFLQRTDHQVKDKEERGQKGRGASHGGFFFWISGIFQVTDHQ
jgi:hypothetical protein